MGVSTHSQPNTCYIFSANIGDRIDALNIARHNMLMDKLREKNIDFAELVGKYNGTMEDSVLVLERQMPESQVAAWAFESLGQDCYLKLTNHKHGMYKAYMVYRDREEFKGYFRSMDKATVMDNRMDYTYKVATNEYFVIWATDTSTMDALEQEKADLPNLALATA